MNGLVKQNPVAVYQSANKPDSIFNASELDNVLTQLLTKRGTLDKLYHKIAYSALLQALPAPYGKATLSFLTRFVQAMGNHDRSSSFKAWVNANSPCHWSQKANAFKWNGKLEGYSVTMAMFSLEQAWLLPYFKDPEKAPNQTDFDLSTVMANMHKQVTKANRSLSNNALALDDNAKLVALELNAKLIELLATMDGLKLQLKVAGEK